MNLPEIWRCLNEIKKRKITGKKTIARKCLSMLYELSNEEEFERIKEDVIFSMIAADPANPLLFNFLKAVMKAKSREESRKAIEKALKYLADVRDRISEHWNKIIQENSVILTNYYSTNVFSLLLEASEKTNFEVIVTESRPSGRGINFAKDLNEAGIDVTLIADNAVNYFMPEVDIVLVGGAAVTKFGLIAPIGTSMIALSAKWNRIPFYAAVELLKVSERIIIGERRGEEIAKGVKTRNPAYDLTRKDLITAYITEDGILNPEKFYSIAMSKVKVI